MSKTRKDREGNIRLRADGRWEVRVTIGIDYATGEERRISRYAKTQEEAIKLLHELSFIRDHTPNNFQSVTVSEWLPFCLETYMRLWGDRIFEKCGIRRDEGGDGGKTLEIRGKRRLSARDGGANYQQS